MLLAASLLFAITLWGGNNTGTKWLIGSWPPVWTGGTRFLGAGLLLLGLLRVTNWFGVYVTPSRSIRRQLWMRGGLSLAVYIVAFNGALCFTSAAHVALYLGASPVWALIWEARDDPAARQPPRYLAALLALTGVGVLLWPALATSYVDFRGELLGFAASVLWTNYGRLSRKLSATLNGAEVTAHTMWRAGVWLLPFGLVEVARTGLPLNLKLLGVQTYCIVAGGVVAFGLWNQALRHWPTSRVLLFNNLIPLSTMAWAYFYLGEAATPTFWVALAFICAGVGIGQK
jgi:drug/metabolite transporter (DMT)-like permease